MEVALHHLRGMISPQFRYRVLTMKPADTDKQCITIPVGVATYFVLPDTPYTTKAKFLTPQECELAISRVTKAGKAAPRGVDLQTFKRVLSKWRWYAFVPGYVVSAVSIVGRYKRTDID